MSMPTNGARDIITQALDDIRGKEQIHHGGQGLCDYGRGQVDALSMVLQVIEGGRSIEHLSSIPSGDPRFKGATYVFKAREGHEEGQVIASGPDGRVCLFDRYTALTSQIHPKHRVLGRIIQVGERHMIVEPIEIVGEYQVPDDGMPEPPPEELVST